jgi:hypothetical protein
MKLRTLMFWTRFLVPVLLLLLPACSLSKTTCSVDQFQVPANLTPHNDTVGTALPVDLSWKYPTSNCMPDFFEAKVWTGLESNNTVTKRLNFTYPDPGGNYHINWVVPLESGKTYFFRISTGTGDGTGQDVSGPEAGSWFFTGPVCSDETMQPVDLVQPADQATINPSGEISFVWDDPTACLVLGLFEIQVSTHPDFSDYLHRIPILQTVYTTDASEFGLDNCTQYYWRVMTDPDGPQEGPYSPTWSFSSHDPNLKCPTATPNPAVAIAQQTLNCRSGPSPLYDTKDAFNLGESAPILGRNADGSWWQITSPHLQIPCWVWGQQVTVQGDTSQVQVVEVAPPVLQPSDTNLPQAAGCGQYKDKNSCNTDAACTWSPSMAGPGVCNSK